MHEDRAPPYLAPPIDEIVTDEMIGRVRVYLKAGRGDRAVGGVPGTAWDEFERACSAFIAAKLKRSQVSPDAWPDIVQEVWLRLILSMRDGLFDRGKGRFSTWLETLVRNASADWRRCRKNRPTAAADPESFELRLNERAAASPEDPVPVLDLLEEALRALRPRIGEVNYHQVARLRLVLGVTVPEVCDRLAIGRDKVYTSCHRTIALVKPLLDRVPEVHAMLRTFRGLRSRPEGTVGTIPPGARGRPPG
jgi:RNA polymerase sigma factor (sigma-70 family)